jgi:hypothetical protein
MIVVQGKSKSVQGAEAWPPVGDSDETPQYSDFDKVIQKDFGIFNDIHLLFSTTNDDNSIFAEESDPLPKASSPQTAPFKVDRLLPTSPPKKITQTSGKQAATSKDMVIGKHRDSDISTKVKSLRKYYKNGSYLWHPKFQKRILHKKLVLREFASICKEINPVKCFRFLTYNLNLDATCLNENLSDRNIVIMENDLDDIKRIISLTHNKQEKFWTWEFEDREAYANELSRGIDSFPGFKKWALSHGHQAMRKLVSSLEGRLES